MLWLLCGAGLIVMLGQGVVAPILPLYGSSFGVSAAMVGFLITSFGLARLVTDLPAGYLTQRYGSARVLMVGPAITAFASLMAGLAGSFWLLFFWRLWQGVGSALYITSAMAWVADLSPSGQAARNLSLYQGAHLVGSSLGPTLGGLAAQYGGGYRAPFFVYAALSVLAVVASFCCSRGHARFMKAGQESLPENGRVSSPPAGPAGTAGPHLPEDGFRAALAALKNKDFLLICLVNFGVFFARAGGRQTVVPLLGAGDLGLSESQIGFALTVVALGNLSTVYLSGWMGDRWGARKVLVPSHLLAGLGYLAFASSDSYFFYLLAAVVVGLGSGLGGPLPPAYALQVGGGTGHGLIMGLQRFFGDTGLMIGPVLLGAAADMIGYRGALTINGAFIAGLIIVFGFLASEPARQAPEDRGTG